MLYNIHIAIELRSEGIWDDVKGFNVPLDFRTSVDLVKDPNFMFGYQYPGEAFMQAACSRDRGERVTKEMWKKWHRGYREWIRIAEKIS